MELLMELEKLAMKIDSPPDAVSALHAHGALRRAEAAAEAALATGDREAAYACYCATRVVEARLNSIVSALEMRGLV